MVPIVFSYNTQKLVQMLDDISTNISQIPLDFLYTWYVTPGQYSSVSQHMLIIMVKFIAVPKSAMNWFICLLGKEIQI